MEMPKVKVKRLASCDQPSGVAPDTVVRLRPPRPSLGATAGN